MQAKFRDSATSGPRTFTKESKLEMTKKFCLSPLGIALAVPVLAEDNEGLKEC
jgi:hypothetical protein